MSTPTFNSLYNATSDKNKLVCPVNTRIPGKVGVGPVMTAAELLATYPKDNPSYRPMPDGSKIPVLGEQEWLIKQQLKPVSCFRWEIM